MKYARIILILIACLAGTVRAAPESDQAEPALDLNAALVLARSESRQFLAYFRSGSCGVCLRFEREVLATKKVREALKGIYFAQVDSEEDQNNFAVYGVRATPTFYIIGADGGAKSALLGYQDEARFLKLIDKVASTQGKSSFPGRVYLPGTMTEETLAENLLQMSDSEEGRMVRQAIANLDPRPLALMVKMLEHPVLAVRLGALETLEAWSGKNFDFDPWAPGSVDNQTALEHWQAWLQDGAVEDETAQPELSFDDALRYINDLQSGNEQAARRARLMLEQGGERIAAMVARFRERNPDLPLDADARLRELHYILLLKQTPVPSPENLAHRLVFGNLDLRMDGMRALGGAESVGRKLLADFLRDPEPLVRETAAEVLLTQFSTHGAGPVLEMLEREKDANIKYIILRNLSVVPGERVTEVLLSYLEHDNEDLVIVSLESLTTLKANDALKSGIPKCLKDPRWRVRVAALKAAQQVKYPEHKQILDMFEDEDPFVRITAVQSVGSLKPSGAGAVLRKAFESDELKAPVIAAFMAMNQKPPREIIDSIPDLKKETIFSILGSVEYADDTILPLLKLLINHEDTDIAAASLRILCQREVKDPEVLQLLAGVFRGGDEARMASVLSRFRLSNQLSQVYRIKDSSSGSSQGNKSSADGLLDRFFNAFARAEAGGSKPAVVNPLQSMRDTADGLLEREGPLQLPAALFLTEIGSHSGIPLLQENLDSLSPDERNQLITALRRSEPNRALPFLKQLLADPDAGVRSSTVRAIYQHHKNPEILTYLFSEIARPGSPLQPAELVNHGFDRAMKNQNSPEIRAALMALLEPAHSDKVKAYALIAMNYSWTSDFLPVVLPHTRSENLWVRRAAWYAVAKNAPETLEEQHERLAADPSPHVRVVLPASFITRSYNWNAHIDEKQFFRDYIYNYRHNQQTPSLGWAQPVIVKMADDESAEVVLTAYQAMMEYRTPFEPGKLAEFITTLPDKAQAGDLLARYFDDQIESLPAEASVLVPYVDMKRNEQLQKKVARKFPQATGTDSADAEASPEAEKTFDFPWDEIAEVTPATSDEADKKSANQALQLIYFEKAGCNECAHVKEMIDRVQETFPALEVRTLNIDKTDAMRLNEALSERFGVPQELRLVAPALYMPSGYLVKDDIVENRIAELVIRSRRLGQTQLEIDDSELGQAGDSISRRYSTVSIGVIAAAGLLDGVNPCAFATIIFLLSYLQMAQRSRTQLAWIGLAYVAGVFCAYFVLGLGLSGIIGKMTAFQWLGKALNMAMAAFAFVIAILSARDGVLCLKGRMRDMKLQLPEFLKGRIHSLIRTTARNRRFVMIAFGIGAVISFLELACTGQVYLPTIVYALKQGESGAWVYLVIYNLAFVTPLLLVFFLSLFGLTSKHLMKIFERHAAIVKFAAAVLFLGLGALLLMSV